MNEEMVKKKIMELQDHLYDNPDDHKRLLNDKEAVLKELGFGAEIVAKFKIDKVKDVSSKGGCKCSSWCGFGCFYGPQIGAEGETCVG